MWVLFICKDLRERDTRISLRDVFNKKTLDGRSQEPSLSKQREGCCGMETRLL